MDYYQILGVQKNSSQDEIKKAFRKLAVEHHPDKGGDEEKFKKINEAYGVLGDEQKKTQYDNQGRNPFEQFGQGFNPFQDFFGNMFYNQRKKTVPDKNIDLVLSIFDCYNGTNKTITYTRKKECGGCNGSGGDRKLCNSCNGEGFRTIRSGTGLFIQLVRQVCSVCNGNGQEITNKCHLCNGEGSKTEIDNVSIQIPRGIDEGNFLKIEGRGDYNSGMYGNLIIRIKIENDELFQKIDKDLVYNAYFSYEDLLKDSIEVPHPTGKIIVKLPDTFDTSNSLRMKHKGFTIGNEIGDLYVKLNVKFNKSHLKK